MGWTGRVEHDLALLSYDEKLVARLRSVDRPHRVLSNRGDGCRSVRRKSGCLPATRKVSGVQA